MFYAKLVVIFATLLQIDMSRTLSLTFQITFTAFVHLLCCWLPLAMILLNGAAIGWVSQYRTSLIVIQLLALAWSFYDVYGQTNHAHSRFEKIALWVVVCFTVLLNLVPHRYFQPEKSRLAQAQVERYVSTRVVEFRLKEKIDSVQKLNNTLQSLEGVVLSQTKIDNHTLKIRYRLGETSKPTILAALRQQGFVVGH